MGSRAAHSAVAGGNWDREQLTGMRVSSGGARSITGAEELGRCLVRRPAPRTTFLGVALDLEWRRPGPREARAAEGEAAQP